jgi:hypothetical protein
MDEGYIFGSLVSIWDANDNERVKINIETCNNPLVVPIYGPYEMENCLMVLIEVANEDYEWQKLLCRVLSTK